MTTTHQMMITIMMRMITTMNLLIVIWKVFLFLKKWEELQIDMNNDVSDNEEDEDGDNRNAIINTDDGSNPCKRMRMQNTQFRDFDTNTNKNSRK